MDCSEIRAAILKNTKIAESIRTCKRKGVACGIMRFEDGELYSHHPLMETEWVFNGPIGRDPTLCSNEVGNCGCIHAEFRAVERCIREHAYYYHEPRYALLINYSPCTSCANLIAVSGCIDRVYYITLTEHDKRGLKHLEKAGVEVVQV